MEKICPKHQTPMLPSRTQYGDRYKCYERGCPFVCWDGETSTPADARMRAARRLAHAGFDRLWGDDKDARSKMYGALAQYMGISAEACHIGMFDIQQCETVILFVGDVIAGKVTLCEG